MSPILFVIPAIVVIAVLLAVTSSMKEGARPEMIIGVAVALVVTALVLVPVIQDEGRSPLPANATFDDYIEIDESTTCSGAFEKVEHEGKYFAHAVDLGIGKIGSMTYTVEKSPLDVYLFLGQSNAANWAGVTNYLVDPVPEYGSGYYFGLSWHQSNKNLNVPIDDYSMRPLRYGGLECSIGGTDPVLAGEYHAITGHKMYIINGAIGGVTIESYLPGGTSYSYAQELFDSAMNEIDTEHFTPELKSYIWIQGESNATTPVEQYKTMFLQIHESLTSGTFSEYGAFESAFISKVRAVNAPNPSTAQIQLADEYASIFLASTLADSFTVANGLMISDDLHYSQYGRNELGAELARFAASHQTN